MKKGKVVRVYRNLARHAYSIMSMERGDRYMRVVDIQHKVTLGCCVPIVQPAGQLSVRESGRRNVHAFIEGVLLGVGVETQPPDGDEWKRIKYNPHEDPGFMVDGEELIYAGLVTFDRTGAYGLCTRTDGPQFKRRHYSAKQQMDLVNSARKQARSAA